MSGKDRESHEELDKNEENRHSDDGKDGRQHDAIASYIGLFVVVDAVYDDDGTCRCGISDDHGGKLDFTELEDMGSLQERADAKDAKRNGKGSQAGDDPGILVLDCRKEVCFAKGDTHQKHRKRCGKIVSVLEHLI